MIENVEFLKPDNRGTKNFELIRTAFRKGFAQGIAFMNESDSMQDGEWRRKAFNDFCKKYKVKKW